MAIAFEISGPIAMFRRPYTTTSSVSFPFPPPTAIAGLLAGIVGFNNNSHEEACSAQYWESLRGTKVALSILTPIMWYTGTTNFWNVKNPQKSPHIQVKHQFVKNPHYRIYVHGGIEDHLRRHLEAETFIYTPYLGTAYAIADIQFCGAFPYQPIIEKDVRISSVLPQISGQSFHVDIVVSKGIFKEQLPFRLTVNRALNDTVTTLYPTSPERKICLTSWEGLDVTRYKDQHIAWFPIW